MEIKEEILNEIERFEQCGTHLDVESFISNLREILGRATPEGFVLVPKELSDDLADELASDAFNNFQSLFDYEHRGCSASQREHIRLRWCKVSAKQYQSDYKAMIEVQEKGDV